MHLVHRDRRWRTLTAMQEEPSQREGQGFKPANSTIVMSEDMTGRPEPYCGYSGALDVSGLLTDSLPGGGADDAAV